MLLAIVATWLAANLYFGDRYKQLIHAQAGGMEKLVAVAVVLWIALTSFYAAFHLLSFLFSVAARRRGDGAARNYEGAPPVALLYPCMNDSQERSLVACLSQDYPDYAVYVLDDSTTREERERVDALGEKFSERVSVIRREKRDGFKAGNLNNALGVIGGRYKYVCVIDADELIPPTFLRELVAIAEGDDGLGFVQASHRQYGRTEYGKLTGDSIDLHWNYFLPARNSFGFVYFYGHGALLRAEALTAVGGFPEVVSEDVALAAKLREAGYRGHYAHCVNSFEETPPSYKAFRRRNQKIIYGTLDFLVRFYPSFLRSAKVSVTEKVDLLISSSVIYLPIPFICFVLLFGLLTPVLSGRSFFSGGGVGSQNTAAMFEPLQRWDFLLYLFLTVFAPVCYLIPAALRSPKKVLLYVLRMGTIHLSVCLHSFGSTLKWIITRRASFVPTGDRSGSATRPFRGYIESATGAGFITAGIVTASLFLIAVGLSLILVPVLNKVDLSSRASSVLVMLPMLIAIVAACGTPVLLLGVTGMLATVALAQP